MFLSVFYASTPPTLNQCIAQWLHAEGIVEPVIVIETSKRLLNLIVMLAACVLFDQTCCWVDSGDHWIIDCKCATFSAFKAHGWREELCILGPHRCAKCLRRYEGINRESAMDSRFVLKKKIKRYAYSKNDNIKRLNCSFREQSWKNVPLPYTMSCVECFSNSVPFVYGTPGTV